MSKSSSPTIQELLNAMLAECLELKHARRYRERASQAGGWIAVVDRRLLPDRRRGCKGVERDTESFTVTKAIAVTQPKSMKSNRCDKDFLNRLKCMLCPRCQDSLCIWTFAYRLCSTDNFVFVRRY